MFQHVHDLSRMTIQNGVDNRAEGSERASVPYYVMAGRSGRKVNAEESAELRSATERCRVPAIPFATSVCVTPRELATICQASRSGVASVGPVSETSPRPARWAKVDSQWVLLALKKASVDCTASCRVAEPGTPVEAPYDPEAKLLPI